MSTRDPDRIGNAGVAIVDEVVNSVFGWIFRRQDASGTDYGVDAHIEVVDDRGTASGHLLAAQIKTGKKYLKPANGSAFTFYGERRHLPYWLGHSLPVLVILVDEKTRTAYWQVVREPLERTKKRWKLSVPRANTLDAGAKATLAEVAHDYARAARAAREGRPTEELARRTDAIESEMHELLPPLVPSGHLTEAPPELDVDVTRLLFRELISWADRADFGHINVPETSRGVYVVAAEHLFFRREITEHDAAKAVVLLLLAREYGKAGSVFLHSVEKLRSQKRLSDPSLLDLLTASSLPDVMPLDLRLVMRITHISARRKHGRPTDQLEDELEHLVAAAGQGEAWALTAAAFYEARWNARRKPERALSYVQKAGLLRPNATGYAGLPFPPSLDATWRLTLELSIYGVRSEADVDQWLEALSAIPQHARDSVLADEMNCLTIANRLDHRSGKEPGTARLEERRPSFPSDRALERNARGGGPLRGSPTRAGGGTRRVRASPGRRGEDGFTGTAIRDGRSTRSVHPRRDRCQPIRIRTKVRRSRRRIPHRARPRARWIQPVVANISQSCAGRRSARPQRSGS